VDDQLVVAQDLGLVLAAKGVIDADRALAKALLQLGRYLYRADIVLDSDGGDVSTGEGRFWALVGGTCRGCRPRR
jgi:hypothetical protein